MPPNLEGQMPHSLEIEPNSDHIHLTLTLLSDTSASTSISEENQSIETDPNEEVDELADTVTAVFRNCLPLEHNIRELLVRVSNTEQLETVTQIKLRVISRELALQQLGTHLPALRELILDGSIIASLRELGYGLRNLKILKVNRCQLTCIDGVLGLEYLEELYATDNNIKDLSPFAFLTNLKIIDVRRNSIKHLGSLNFLNLCPDLTHVLLEGNEATNTLVASRKIIGRILPNLEMLDGDPVDRDGRYLAVDIALEDLEEDDESDERSGAEVPEKTMFNALRINALHRVYPRTSDESNGFSVRFPPRLCGSNDLNVNNGKST